MNGWQLKKALSTWADESEEKARIRKPKKQKQIFKSRVKRPYERPKYNNWDEEAIELEGGDIENEA